MELEFIFILLGVGIVAGLGSGLLGVGGGFIMTPVQVAVYAAMGLPTDMAVKLAFGTTLAVILPTSLSGAWRHSKHGAVWYRAALIMGTFSFLGSFGGSALAVLLPGNWLKIAFGVLSLLAGIRMLFAQKSTTSLPPRTSVWLWIGISLPLGVITGLLGIGGGILVIPLMVLALRFPMRQAVATSLAMMVLTSLGGTVGYIVNGWNISGLPPFSLGYVCLPAWLVLTVSSIGMAQIGAMMAHRLQVRWLHYIFVALTLYVGLRMIGVFEWLGWPL